MTRTTFTPRPSPTPEPVLRPASPKLPGAPVIRHQTLPYGVPVVSRPIAASGVHIQTERPAFIPPVAVDSVFTDTQKLVALTWMEPSPTASFAGAEMFDDPTIPGDNTSYVIASKLQKMLPLGLAAGLGFLVAYFL